MDLELFANPWRLQRRRPWPDGVLTRAGHERAWRAIAGWPGYEPTPLISLPGMAKELGVGEILMKHEAPRFGLGSFKALGGAYAVYRLKSELIGEPDITPADLLERAGEGARPTVCCATDGNHGRAVAWGARQFGCNSVVYLHQGVSAGRQEAIESYGALVVRCEGTYDDSVRRCAADAEHEGWHVISDTSWPGYERVPRQIMHGYTVMAEEIVRQWPDVSPGAGATHVLLQGGVGGLAAAVCDHLLRRWRRSPLRLAVVEPSNAGCLWASAKEGEPTTLTGELTTVMACLECGEPSPLAWSVLRQVVDDFVLLGDRAAIDMMRSLARGRFGDPPQVVGESGVAGLAALRAVCRDSGARGALGLDRRSRVLTIATEGATDRGLYRQLAGLPSEQVDAVADSPAGHREP